jgi:regulator of sigma E protease
MNFSVFTVIYGILGLSMVVFVHELGHFIAARICGIEVLRFSIGMGKRLFGFTFKGTDYCLSMFPIGGYCKMKGEESLIKAFNSGGEIGKEPGSLYAAHPLKRILVAVMGPFFNVLFAAVALSIAAFIGYTYQGIPSRILLASEYPNIVSASDKQILPYPADKSGLKSGDIVKAINGTAIENYSMIQEIVSRNPDKKLSFGIDRDGQRIVIEVVPFLDRDNVMGRIGVLPWMDPVVDTVAKKGPALAAGLQSGDRIAEIEGKAIRSAYDVEYALRGAPESLRLGLDRSGRKIELILKPEYRGRKGKESVNVGFSTVRQSFRVQGLGFFPGIAKGVSDTVQAISLTFKGIGLLFKSKLGAGLGGPIRMVVMMGSTAESGFKVGIGFGFASIFELLSFISIGLFITNLLPLPILDGGMVIITVIELFRKKMLKAETIYKITLVGVFLLLGIFLFTTFNDILFYAKG